MAARRGVISTAYCSSFWPSGSRRRRGALAGAGDHELRPFCLQQRFDRRRVLGEQRIDGSSVVHRAGERQEVPASFGLPRFLLGVAPPLQK